MRLRHALLAALASVLAAGEVWRPAEHPAMLERCISALTRPSRILAVASEVPGRLCDSGPPPGSAIAPGVALALDPAWAEAELRLARAQLAQAEAEAAYRAREAERAASLHRAGRLAEAERDAAVHAAERAALARAAAEAALARTELQLARHRIELPAGWVVVRRWREAGSVVAPGEPILELADVAAVLADLQLSPEELAALPGASVEAGGQRWAPIGWRVRPLADPQTRRLPVELELPGAVGSGREVQVRLALPDPLGAVLVPAAAVLADRDGRFVRTRDGRRLPLTVLRALDGALAVLPTPELLAAELTIPAP